MEEAYSSETSVVPSKQYGATFGNDRNLSINQCENLESHKSVSLQLCQLTELKFCAERQLQTWLLRLHTSRG